MAVLLRTHTVSRTRPEPVEDEHGWVLPDPVAGTDPVDYAGNLQLEPAAAAVTADEQGGAGPYQPRVVQTARIYLDEGADVLPGDVLTVDTYTFTVRSVSPMPDPATTGAGCLLVEVST